MMTIFPYHDVSGRVKVKDRRLQCSSGDPQNPCAVHASLFEEDKVDIAKRLIKSLWCIAKALPS